MEVFDFMMHYILMVFNQFVKEILFMFCCLEYN